MSYYRDQLENYLKNLDIKALSVLDIGGGANPVATRVKSWEVKEYKILDNCLEKMSAIPDIVEDLNKPFNLTQRFDCVFCLEVFEYVYSPMVALRNIFNCLKLGGVAIITFPFVYPLHQPVECDYLRYTENGILKLLKVAGFNEQDIIIRYRTDRSGKLQEFYKADGMHPAKGLQHNVVGYIVEATK